MKRITKIEIKNFQSHKNTVVEPTPGLTVIVGHTDSGKSAFIRALKWCLYNKQPRSQLINKDADYASVCVSFSDGSSIFRYKSKNKKDNYYIVVDKDGKESTYTSVGNMPLKEVMDISGMYEVNMFNRDISLNMTDQFDPLFFLAENPTDRGTLISQMANTEVCDAAIAICSTKINATKKIITSLQKTIKTKKESLAEYNYLEELKNVIDTLNSDRDDVVRAENLHSSIFRANNDTSAMMQVLGGIYGKTISVEDVEKENEKLESLAVSLRNKDILTSCCNFATDIDKIAQCLLITNAISDADFIAVEDKLNTLLAAIQAQQRFIMIQAEIINDIGKLSLCSTPISAEEIDSIVDETLQMAERKNLISSIRGIVTEHNNLIGCVKDAEVKINAFMDEEANVKKAYENALTESEICPVCGNIMDEEHLKHSVENL